MKILFINDMYTVGGATKALVELLMNLKKDGHTPIVCTSYYDDFNVFLDSQDIVSIVDGHISAMETVPDEQKKRYDLKKRRYDYFKARLKAMKIITKSIDMSSIDLIHTNSIRNDVGCLLYKKYQIPHVMHIREFGQEDFGCVIHMPHYYHYLNKHSTMLLAVSKAVRMSAVSKGISSNKIRTLYDGVDFEGFNVKEKNCINDERLSMVMVGGVDEAKGQHIAVKALARLPEKIREKTYLDIIGWNDPAYLEYLNLLIYSLQLKDHVRLLGNRNDVGQLLSNYHIGLMCSKCEGFGRVTAEYLYAGLGVIAADTGASPELVHDGETGLIYRRDDPKDLADKIVRLYEHPELLGFFGLKAHSFAKLNLTSQLNYRKTMHIYRSILGYDDH